MNINRQSNMLAAVTVRRHIEYNKYVLMTSDIYDFKGTVSPIFSVPLNSENT